MSISNYIIPLLTLGIPKIINWINNRRKVICYGTFIRANIPTKVVIDYLSTVTGLKLFLEEHKVDKDLANSLIKPFTDFLSDAPIFDTLSLYVVNNKREPLNDLKIRLRDIDIYHACYTKSPQFYGHNPLEINKRNNQFIIAGFDQILPKQRILVHALGYLLHEVKVMGSPVGGVLLDIDRYVEVTFKDGMAECRKLKKFIWTSKKGVQTK